MYQRLANVFVAIFLAAAFTTGVASAQKVKGPSERSVSGIVSDAGGKPVAGAIVQLENKKTLQVRSFIAQQDGRYFFNGLSTDVDYELSAKSGELVGPKKILSSFDSRKEAVINLALK